MTMRKYIVTIHEDGSVTALEYEEHDVYSAYQTGKQSAAREIVDMLKTRKIKQMKRAQESANGKEWDRMRANIAGAVEDHLVLRWIENRFHLS